ncbi:MAG: ABC transporter permease subunit [Ruminococcus sp.]|nr:ABC transporter [Ruminococcus sp.]MBQ9956333.1 ABC transporter permease subunit [Ruminococcus sp.]MBR6792374.1 ABC transporter permease subunit [Ruminococcus sp.]
MGAIYRREINAFFTSGLAYVFLSVYFLFSGYFFYQGTLSQATTDTSPMFNALFLIVLFLIPILTMRLLSEEKKQKTDQGLLTAPIGLWSIVLGKYFAALTLFVIAESIVFVYALILSYFGTVVWSTLLANYFAMLLLGAAFIAVGVFISSLTENQMASAVASFLALMLLYMIDSIGNGIPVEFIQKLFVSLSFYTRYVEFTMGIFNLSSVVFYLSAAFIFNFFTVRVLEKRRWG